MLEQRNGESEQQGGSTISPTRPPWTLTRICYGGLQAYLETHPALFAAGCCGHVLSRFFRRQRYMINDFHSGDRPGRETSIGRALVCMHLPLHKQGTPIVGIQGYLPSRSFFGLRFRVTFFYSPTAVSKAHGSMHCAVWMCPWCSLGVCQSCFFIFGHVLLCRSVTLLGSRFCCCIVTSSCVNGV